MKKEIKENETFKAKIETLYNELISKTPGTEDYSATLSKIGLLKNSETKEGFKPEWLVKATIAAPHIHVPVLLEIDKN